MIKNNQQNKSIVETNKDTKTMNCPDILGGCTQLTPSVFTGCCFFAIVRIQFLKLGPSLSKFDTQKPLHKITHLLQEQTLHSKQYNLF